MSTTVIAPATFEPVTSTDVKTYLRIDLDNNDEDPFLRFIITQCRIDLERSLRRALCSQTMQSVLEFDLPPQGDLSGWIDFTTGRIELPYPPTASIVQVSIESQPGIFSLLTSDTYYTDTTTEPGRVWIQATAFDTLSLPVWSIWSEPFYPRVEVQFMCGYATPAAIPANYKLLLLQMIAEKYANREGNMSPLGITDMIKREKNYLL